MRMPATALVMMAAAALIVPPVAAQESAEPPGMTYEALQRLPRIEGSWVPEAFPFDQSLTPSQQRPMPPELTPQAAEAALAYRRKLLGQEQIDRGYCEMPAFAGRLPMNGGGAIEILFNPGRVTIATEGGIVRRIYYADSFPTAPENTRSGTSIGRWEGGTLHIRTTGISPGAFFLGGLPVGEGAQSTEAIALLPDGRLQVRTTVTAPAILTRPQTSVNTYRRVPDRPFTEFDTCPAQDRTFDAETRREQFDATPPDDLPPPPAD